MKMHTRLMLCVAVLSMFVCDAANAGLVHTVLEDTITRLEIKWTWDRADADSLDVYKGANWDVAFAPTVNTLGWELLSTYWHLDGPHGETTEHIAGNNGAGGHDHFLTITNVEAKKSSSGIEDHLVRQHPMAHHWKLSGNVSFGAGEATLIVTHVPEPASLALFLTGFALFLGIRFTRLNISHRC